MRKSVFYLFTEEGASVHSSESNPSFPNRTWALADSAGDLLEPCEAFRKNVYGSQLFVIQACSPKATRWKSWAKQHSVQRYVMESMSIEELSALG
jgi:hypothetical protein